MKPGTSGRSGSGKLGRMPATSPNYRRPRAQWGQREQFLPIDPYDPNDPIHTSSTTSFKAKYVQLGYDNKNYHILKYRVASLRKRMFLIDAFTSLASTTPIKHNKARQPQLASRLSLHAAQEPRHVVKAANCWAIGSLCFTAFC